MSAEVVPYVHKGDSFGAFVLSILHNAGSEVHGSLISDITQLLRFRFLVKSCFFVEEKPLFV